MVLYGWWYLIGVAVVVLVFLVYIGPSEDRFWKRRIKLVQERIRKKEEKEAERQEKQERLEREKRTRRMYGRTRHRFIRKKK